MSILCSARPQIRPLRGCSPSWPRTSHNLHHPDSNLLLLRNQAISSSMKTAISRCVLLHLHSSPINLVKKDLWFWPRAHPRPSNDRLRFHTLLPRPGNYAHMAKVRRCGWYLEHRMHLCRDVGRKASLSREGPYVTGLLCCRVVIPGCVRLDVNQFSIITELLGTPPDDVIETICSENVCFFCVDPSL